MTRYNALLIILCHTYSADLPELDQQKLMLGVVDNNVSTARFRDVPDNEKTEVITVDKLSAEREADDSCDSGTISSGYRIYELTSLRVEGSHLTITPAAYQ